MQGMDKTDSFLNPFSSCLDLTPKLACCFLSAKLRFMQRATKTHKIFETNSSFYVK